MSRIGHASINELGRTSSGQAGDQTGKEVCTRSWYSKNWSYVLRPLDKNIAEKMADACEKGCVNNHIGYDQGQRNTLKTQAQLCGMDLSRITVDCECDCSSFMTVCAECAGVSIAYNNGNAPTTSTMKTAFMNTGCFELLSDEKYLTSDKYLKRGDILVAVGSHTVMVLSNGELADIAQKAPKEDKIKAVDLSKYNTVTNYITLAKDVKYAIIRVGYRSYEKGILTVDDLFNKHIENCIANNVLVGVYFYDQSINESEAKEEAEWVVNMIKPYSVSLPIYIDSEYSNKSHNGRADNISKEQRTKNVIAFCKRIQELGHTVGIYASDSWFKSMLDYDKIKDYHIWCARYSVNKPTISHYDIWQYGSEQFVWALKPIDVNWIYKLPTKSQKPKNEPNTDEIKGDKNLSYDYKVSNMVKVSDYLNVRMQPLSTSPVIGKLYNNDKIDIYGYVKDWYMISPKMDKWVSDKYVSVEMKKTKTNLNYRENVGTNSAVLGMYEKGTIIKLLNKKVYQNEYWYLCVDDKERFGWCSGKYIE